MSVQGYYWQTKRKRTPNNGSGTEQHKVFGEVFIPHEEKTSSLNYIVLTEINFVPDKRIEHRVAPADPRVN